LHKKIPTVGVWDDHDFAMNDGNGYFSHKEISKKLFLDYMDEPVDSDRRTLGKGIYTTYSFGNGYKTVRLILLDVRFNKTSYMYDWEKSDIIGEEQWTWLEEVLNSNDETFTFISTGIQVLPFNRIMTESWYYNSRKRLFDLIARTKKSGVVILSGDIHCAQLLKTFCTLPKIGYDLYEITSSGLSHYFRPSVFIEYFLPSDYNIIPTIASYNFAKIDLVYGEDKYSSKIVASIIDDENIVRARLNIPYTNLIFNNTKYNDDECEEKINSRFKTIKEYFEYYNSRPFEIVFLIPYLWLIYLFYKLIMLILWILYFPLRLIRSMLRIKIKNE
jgi:hypothetical protein